MTLEQWNFKTIIHVQRNMAKTKFNFLLQIKKQLQYLEKYQKKKPSKQTLNSLYLN